jgi:hypothetical protein
MVLQESSSLQAPEADVARKYLANRGVGHDDLGNDILFHPGLEYWENGAPTGRHPSLVVRIRNGAKHIGLQTTFLSDDGGKAAVASPRKTRGKLAGGAVRIGNFANAKIVAVTEGVETGIAVFRGTGLPVLATLSAENMPKLNVDDLNIDGVVVFADRDPSGAGEKAARELRANLLEKGIPCKVILPPKGVVPDDEGVDWADLYKADGRNVFISIDFQNTQNSDVWGEPRALPALRKNPPPLSVAHLPPFLQPYVSDLGMHMQQQFSFVMAPFLCILSSLVARRFAIRVAVHDAFVLYPNLWALLIAPPSYMKSPILARLMALLKKLIAEADELYAREFASVSAEIRKLQARNAMIEKS